MDDEIDLICNLLNTSLQIARILWTVQLIYLRIILPVSMEMLPKADIYDNRCQNKDRHSETFGAQNIGWVSEFC
jgi:hypothetical protein